MQSNLNVESEIRETSPFLNGQNVKVGLHVNRPSPIHLFEYVSSIEFHFDIVLHHNVWRVGFDFLYLDMFPRPVEGVQKNRRVGSHLGLNN